MADIQQAAIWAAQGEDVRRSTWSPDIRSDDYRRSLSMSRDRRLMTTNSGRNNWYEASITIEDVLGDDWIKAQRA